MDSELKKIRELENQVIELKSALEKERLKAEILNNMIENADERQNLDIRKINIPCSTDSSQTKE
jgi:hypothetical protein